MYKIINKSQTFLAINVRVFSNKNLTTKRTGGDGMVPTEWDALLGKASPKKFNKNQPIILGVN